MTAKSPLAEYNVGPKSHNDINQNLNTEIGDSGIEHLESLPWLKRLDLMSSRVSDACIPRLRRFSSLRHLRIYQTRISENGYLEIAEALPDCHIWFYRSNDLG